MRKFQGNSLRAQKGDESHYVSDLPVGSGGYDSDGVAREVAGIFERVEGDFDTKARLVEVVYATDKESAEALADKKLGGFNKGSNKKDSH